MNEDEALGRIKGRDEEGLAWLIQRYAAYVHTIIRNIAGKAMPETDAEQLSADVFFTLWVNAKRVAPGKVKAYLGGVARNKAKERLRKTGREIFLQDDALLIAPENPERSFEERDQARYIRRAILTMAPTQREIFFRYYYFYQPVATIAREMDISPAAVKTQLHRGRKKLKELIIKGGYTVED